MTDNLIAQFESKIREAKRQDKANYFLVEVAKVKVKRGDPDAFMVEGRRLDNGQEVFVTSRKSTLGQHLPRAGSVMRADKASAAGTGNGKALYNAAYFHAYGVDDLCIDGLVRAIKPYRAQSGMVSASVQVLNIENNGGFVTRPGELDSALLAALKPWAAEQSALSHDAKGKAIWSEKGGLGIQPMVLVRMVGGENVVALYGLGAVDQRKGEDDAPDPRLPTDEEILAHVRKNKLYPQIAQMSQHPDFAKYGFALIPGMQINVGRGCLTGGQENHLAAPRVWDWEHRTNLPEGAEPKKERGWRGGYIHVKQTDIGRHIVVDAVPSNSYRLTGSVPKSKLEQDVLADRAGATTGAQQQKAQQPATREVQRPSAPAPEAQRQQAQQSAPKTQRQQAQTPAPQQARPQQSTAVQEPALAPHVAEQVPMDAYEVFDEEDMTMFADDFAAMEAMAAAPTPIDQNAETDALLEEAAQRQQQRRINHPRM